jgi:phosphoribosylanthranilate isomerase
MARTRIKICGVRDPATAVAAADAGADAVGLVFAPGSPRCVTQAEAAAVIAVLPPMVEPIALFVNEPVARVRMVCAALGIRCVQLHGDETPEQVAQLAPLRVIKAIPFVAGEMETTLAPWRMGPVRPAALLWDAPMGKSSGGQRGGSGTTLDWDALRQLQHQGMMAGLPASILAGGLNPGNVGQAIATVGPFAVDVSSGVESSRGVKDPALIQAFCAAVRAADGA